jgi:ATP-binding cassette, subfamily B, bacterial
MRAIGRPPAWFRRRRTPVVLQMTVSDCGPACLASILRYHGRHTELEECRRRIGLGRDGVTARTIVTVAHSFGLRVRAYSVGPLSVEHLMLPAIAHWEDAHFVVIERFTETHVEIVDPALGRRRITRAEFGQGLGGVVLIFEPGPAFEQHDAGPRHRRFALPARLRGWIAGCRAMLIAALAASLALQLLGLALPIASAVVIDRIVAPRDAGLLPILGVAIIALTLTHFVIKHVRGIVLIRLQTRIDGEIMRGLFGHLLSLPLPFFQQRTGGDVMQRLASSIVIRELITTQALGAVLDGGFMFVYLVVLITANATLGVLVTGLGLAQAALLLSTHGRSHRLRQRHLLAQSKSQSILFETLGGIATVKATGSEERVFDAWSQRFSAEIAIDAEQNRLDALVENATTTLRVLAPLVLVWIGAHQVLDGTLTLGAMVALQTLAMAFLTPLGGLVASLQRLQSVGAHLERLRDVLDAPPEQVRRARRGTPRLSGRTELRSIAYRYDPNSPLVLRDISLTIEPGQKIALVGRSGSGKSTLGMLLLGLYPPTEGEILYDEVPLADLDLRDLRTRFGVVLQEPFIFGDSIRRNIAGNEPSMPLERVARAARVAAFDDDVDRMPMRYETRLGDRGGGLSGGQRQRLAIARAVARDPALLLFDEATSHLDVLTEHRVDSNLDGLSCTRIVIAHRVSTVRNADLILVLEAGEIIERGSHDELVRRGGLYAQLVHGQATEDPARGERCCSYVKVDPECGFWGAPMGRLNCAESRHGVVLVTEQD